MNNPPQAEITLSTSRAHGLVAIASGEEFLQARDALEEAGFSPLPGGAFATPLTGAQAARDTASALVHRAHEHGTSITTSSRPYLGDIGQEIASRLPGTWSATVEIYSRKHWQEDIVGSLWDSGDLLKAMLDDHIPCAVTLNNHAGTQLMLIEHPGHSSGYLVGAFATEEYDDNWEEPNAPRSIALPAETDLAARAIAHTFLPNYRRALHHRRLDTVISALNRIRPEHETMQAIKGSGRFSDGMPLATSRLLPKMERAFADHAWLSFRDVLQHAPLLLSRCRPTASPWPQDAPRAGPATRGTRQQPGCLGGFQRPACGSALHPCGPAGPRVEPGTQHARRRRPAGDRNMARRQPGVRAPGPRRRPRRARSAVRAQPPSAHHPTGAAPCFPAGECAPVRPQRRGLPPV